MPQSEELKLAFPLSTIRVRNGLIVRPLVKSDLAELIAILAGDPEMSWSRSSWSRANVEYLLSHRLRHYDTHGFGPYAVILDGHLIGMAGAQVWEEGSEAVELLAYIAKSHWGRGLATELLGWSVMRLEHFTKQAHVFATTRPENARARSMVRRLGFQPMGKKSAHFGHEAITWRRKLRNG